MGCRHEIPDAFRPAGSGVRPGLLAELVQEHLPQLIEEAEAADTPIPAFVQNELSAMASCGDFIAGFLRSHATTANAPWSSRSRAKSLGRAYSDEVQSPESARRRIGCLRETRTEQSGYPAQPALPSLCSRRQPC